MGFVGEKIAVENGGGAVSTMVGTLTEDVIRVAAKHTTREATRIGTLKVSSGVDREVGGGIGRSRLITSHSFLGGRHERTGRVGSGVEGHTESGR